MVATTDWLLCLGPMAIFMSPSYETAIRPRIMEVLENPHFIPGESLVRNETVYALGCLMVPLLHNLATLRWRWQLWPGWLAWVCVGSGIWSEGDKGAAAIRVADGGHGVCMWNNGACVFKPSEADENQGYGKFSEFRELEEEDEAWKDQKTFGDAMQAIKDKHAKPDYATAEAFQWVDPFQDFLEAQSQVRVMQLYARAGPSEWETSIKKALRHPSVYKYSLMHHKICVRTPRPAQANAAKKGSIPQWFWDMMCKEPTKEEPEKQEGTQPPLLAQLRKELEAFGSIKTIISGIQTSQTKIDGFEENIAEIQKMNDRGANATEGKSTRRITKEIEALEKKISEKETYINELQVKPKEGEDSESIIQTSQTEIAELKKILTEKIVKKEKLKELKEDINEIEALTKEIEALDQKISEKETHIQEKQKKHEEHESITSDIQRSQTEIAELKKNIMEKKSMKEKIEAFEPKMAPLLEIQKLKEEEAMEGSMESLKGIIAQMESQVESWDALAAAKDLASVLTSVAEKKKEIEGKRTKIMGIKKNDVSTGDEIKGSSEEIKGALRKLDETYAKKLIEVLKAQLHADQKAFGERNNHNVTGVNKKQFDDFGHHFKVLNQEIEELDRKMPSATPSEGITTPWAAAVISKAKPELDKLDLERRELMETIQAQELSRAYATETKGRNGILVALRYETLKTEASKTKFSRDGDVDDGIEWMPGMYDARIVYMPSDLTFYDKNKPKTYLAFGKEFNELSEASEKIRSSMDKATREEFEAGLKKDTFVGHTYLDDEAVDETAVDSSVGSSSPSSVAPSERSSISGMSIFGSSGGDGEDGSSDETFEGEGGQKGETDEIVLGRSSPQIALRGDSTRMATTIPRTGKQWVLFAIMWILILLLVPGLFFGLLYGIVTLYLLLTTPVVTRVAGQARQQANVVAGQQADVGAGQQAIVSLLEESGETRIDDPLQSRSGNADEQRNIADALTEVCKGRQPRKWQELSGSTDDDAQVFFMSNAIIGGHCENPDEWAASVLSVKRQLEERALEADAEGSPKMDMCSMEWTEWRDIDLQQEQVRKGEINSAINWGQVLVGVVLVVLLVAVVVFTTGDAAAIGALTGGVVRIDAANSVDGSENGDTTATSIGQTAILGEAAVTKDRRSSLLIRVLQAIHALQSRIAEHEKTAKKNQ